MQACIQRTKKSAATRDSNHFAAAERPSVLVARQPIFDRQLDVCAYELLYREEGADRARITNAARATAEVLAVATLDIGLNRLVGEAPAFVNFPADLLLGPLQLPMAPGRIVIELLEGADAGEPLLERLAQLRREGYRIALDDFDMRVGSMELLEHADIVKVDIQEHTPGELQECVRELRRRDLQLLAEKIETVGEFECCRALGFDLFQGYFLQRPEMFRERRVPNSRVAALELLLSLDEARSSAEWIETCVARDVGLSYRILRCINSSYYQVPREVGSIRQAVLLLGHQELRRICSVVLLASADDRPAYLALQALTRARMCESLSALASDGGTGDGYFTAGLLSLADVLLGMPMKECLQRLPLSDSLTSALLLHEGPMGVALECVLSFERGDWERVRFAGLSKVSIASAYADAVQWAETACAAWRNVQ